MYQVHFDVIIAWRFCPYFELFDLPDLFRFGGLQLARQSRPNAFELWLHVLATGSRSTEPTSRCIAQLYSIQDDIDKVYPSMVTLQVWPFLL